MMAPTVPRIETTLAHHSSCIAEQAWDIPEAQDHCGCPAFWPRRVCTSCWQSPKRHRKDCAAVARVEAAR